jgi:hypothetical protein
MTESYHATQCWLAFIGEPTMRIEDPTEGVVQLHTERFIVRIRVASEAASQGSVIAMLRAAAEIEDLTMLMFSPTGYNLSAIEFAELRGIPLFTLSPFGEVIGETLAARALIPEGEYDPPFADREEEEEDDFMAEPEPDPEPDFEDRFDLAQVEWKSCPRCNASQHPDLVQCAACGADLNARLTFIGGTEPESHVGHSPLTPRPTPPPAPRAGTSSLQCRNCGSHDIDLIHN